jgi:hypothetical protein
MNPSASQHTNSLAGIALTSHRDADEPYQTQDYQDDFQARVQKEAAARLQQQQREKLGLVDADEGNWQQPLSMEVGSAQKEHIIEFEALCV